MKKFFKDNATLIALFVLGLILTIVTSFEATDGKVTFDIMNNMFFNARNLNNLTRQVTLIGIISIGMTMVTGLFGLGSSDAESSSALRALLSKLANPDDLRILTSLILPLGWSLKDTVHIPSHPDFLADDG